MHVRVLFSSWLIFAACSDSAPQTVETELSPEVPYEGVCWHFTEQVPQTVYAASTRDEFLEVVSLEHTAIRVMLGDLKGGNAGFERLDVYPGGCEELQGIWKGVLGAKPYDLLFGPTDVDEVTVVFAAGASEHNHT